MTSPYLAGMGPACKALFRLAKGFYSTEGNLPGDCPRGRAQFAALRACEGITIRNLIRASLLVLSMMAANRPTNLQIPLVQK